jgi:hypothetical protein
MYCDAKKRESEYAGRPHLGQTEKKDIRDAIPKVPFSINPSENAHNEEYLAHQAFDRKQKVVESFNSKLRAKVERRQQRKEKRYLMDLKKNKVTAIF